MSTAEPGDEPGGQPDEDRRDEQLSGESFGILAIVGAVLAPVLVIAVIVVIVLLSRRTDPPGPPVSTVPAAGTTASTPGRIDLSAGG